MHARLPFVTTATTLANTTSLLPLNLPLLPSDDFLQRTLDPVLLQVGRRHNIPRILWIAVKNASEVLPSHLVHDLFRKNDLWKVVIFGNKEKDAFIDDIWNGTRVQWMYHLIHPNLGAAKADIWRYAALYCYGGFYIDYDANMKVKLDDIIQVNDTLILAEDGTVFFDYFRTEFKLSNNATFAKHHPLRLPLSLPSDTTTAVRPYVTGYDPATGWPQFFHNRFLLNWAIFAAPKNPAMVRSMENMALILWSEFMREPVVAFTTSYAKYLLLLFCTYYPLTTSIRELLLENNTPGFNPRISNVDFREYGGKCKAMNTAHDTSHYRSVIKKTVAPDLLHTYATGQGTSTYTGPLSGSGLANDLANGPRTGPRTGTAAAGTGSLGRNHTDHYTRVVGGYNLTNAVRWIEGWTVMAHLGGKAIFAIARGVKV